jgi:TetR/AcrR family transcriptional regulator
VRQAARKIRRPRRVTADIRERLLDAALVEFGAKGFEAASTRAIARRIGAHQPQIHYHFATKEALWNAAVDRLFGELARTMRGLAVGRRRGGSADVAELAATFGEMIRRFVRFAARHPELNQIMVHEATAKSGRLEWMTERHVKPLYDTVRPWWRRLRAAGVAAPIDARLFHYVLVGAASLLYVNAAEARLLTRIEPTADRWVDIHAEGLVAMLLPNAPPTVRRDASDVSADQAAASGTKRSRPSRRR